jgi:MscS family membrane protein
VHAGQATWKWTALALVLVLFAMALIPVYRLSRRVRSERVFLNALVRLILPVFFLMGILVVSYLAQAQINLVDAAADAIIFLSTVVLYFAGAWVVWRAASVLAEALVALPRLGSQSIDAHLIRLCTRLGGLALALTLVVSGANQLGIPVYGIVAGLGIGGLAIALAAQPTVENLIGGLNIFADRPIRVGSFCKYGNDSGTVETIGIRSTRIRGLNRTITTIPNAILSKMPIVNYAERDRMLIQCVLNLRYETSKEQLQYLLASLRKMLLDHPRIHPEETHVRVVGFGASSLDVEVFAYVTTRDWDEFLGIREGVFLQIMAVFESSGTTFAFPSQTLYSGRDGGLDAAKTEAAEAQLKSWRHEGRLGSLGFSAEAPRPDPETVAGRRPGSPATATGEAQAESEAAEQPTPPGANPSV